MPEMFRLVAENVECKAVEESGHFLLEEQPERVVRQNLNLSRKDQQNRLNILNSAPSMVRLTLAREIFLD